MENNSASKSAIREALGINNSFRIEATPDKDFFKWWCILLRPFVSLTNREVDVIASFLRQRWELSKHISDPAILDTILMSEDVKRKVQEECKITLQHFYVVMSNLKKNGVIVNNRLHPRLIPDIQKNKNGRFILMIHITDKNFVEE